jgi:hypothetical protein
MAQRKQLRLTVEDKRKIWDTTGGRCHFCGIQTEFTNRGVKGPLETYWEVDHVLPIAKEGSNELTNLLCICRRCNMSKKTTGAGLRRLLLLGRIAKGEYYKGSKVGQKIGILRIKQLANNWYARETQKLKGTGPELRLARKSLRAERDHHVSGMEAFERAAVDYRSSHKVKFTQAKEAVRGLSKTPEWWITSEKRLTEME